MRHYSDSTDLWTALICFALVLLIAVGFNTCTADEWNSGECPKCDTRYELRGVTKYMKCYACPECGNEVNRFY